MQLLDVGDGSVILVTKILSFHISVGHQSSKYVTDIEIQSPISTNRHQLYVTMSPTSLSPY